MYAWCGGHARSELILNKVINVKKFGSKVDTTMLTGTVDGVEYQTSTTGRKLRYVVATYKYGGGRMQQATLALQNVHNGPGPAHGKDRPGLSFMPQGLVPMVQTVIQPGDPITLDPPVDPSKVAAASLFGSLCSQ